MGPTVELIVAGDVAGEHAGCGGMDVGLAGKTLEVADQWSSVLTGITTLVLAPAGFCGESAGVAVSRRSVARPPQQPVNRTQIVQTRDVSAPIINGDRNR